MGSLFNSGNAAMRQAQGAPMPQQQAQQQQMQQSGGQNQDPLGMAFLLIAGGVHPSEAFKLAPQMAAQQSQANAQQQQVGMQRQEFDLRQQEVQDKQKAQQQMMALLGDEGVLSGADPETATLAKVAFGSGNINQGLDILMRGQNSYTAPQTVQDEQGNPTLIQTDRKGNIKPVEGFKPFSPLDKEVAKSDASVLTKSRESVEQALKFKPTLDNLKNALDKVPTDAQGRIVGQASPYFGADEQTFQAYSNTVTALSRSLLGFPAAGFSDADRQFLEKASAGLTNEAQTNYDIIKGLNRMLDQTIDMDQALYKHVNDKGKVGSFLSDYYKDKYGSSDSNSRSKDALNGSTSTKTDYSALTDDQLKDIIRRGKGAKSR